MKPDPFENRSEKTEITGPRPAQCFYLRVGIVYSLFANVFKALS